jgi:hypothetical protein
MPAVVDLPPRADVLPQNANAIAHSDWRRHAYILPSFALALIVCAWFITWGDWKFFEREYFCGFYDAEALSMLDGRFDVPPGAIGDEAFIFQGKAYGYFGIAPALLRLPLVVAFENMDGRWSRLMMLIGCGINLFCAYRILLLVRGNAQTTNAQRWLHSLFILCAGVGSTDIFIAGRSFTYHEAIMWGSAFALLFVWALLKYWARPNLRYLILAACCAFMSFHSRPTAGAGALLALCGFGALLLWRARVKGELRLTNHALVAFAAATFIVAVFFAVNYAKFRTFNGVPLQYYAWYHRAPVRMQITGGRQFHVSNIPTTLLAYFGLPRMTIDRQFPWFYPSRRATIIGSPAIDMVDRHSSIPESMPALTCFAIIGCFTWRRARNETISCAGALGVAMFAGGALVLMSVGICERYLHDFYPALIIAAALGLTRLEKSKYVWPLTLGSAVLALISIALNCSFSLNHQRTTTGAPPEKEAEFRGWQRDVSHWLGR